jgi:hypothetical protein
MKTFITFCKPRPSLTFRNSDMDCAPDFQAGWLVLKSSGGELAWFLTEESEPRNKLILLAGENQRAEELSSLM